MDPAGRTGARPRVLFYGWPASPFAHSTRRRTEVPARVRPSPGVPNHSGSYCPLVQGCMACCCVQVPSSRVQSFPPATRSCADHHLICMDLSSSRSRGGITAAIARRPGVVSRDRVSLPAPHIICSGAPPVRVYASLVYEIFHERLVGIGSMVDSAQRIAWRTHRDRSPSALRVALSPGRNARGPPVALCPVRYSRSDRRSPIRCSRRSACFASGVLSHERHRPGTCGRGLFRVLSCSHCSSDTVVVLLARLGCANRARRLRRLGRRRIHLQPATGRAGTVLNAVPTATGHTPNEAAAARRA